MPVQKGKSSLAAKLGQKGAKAVNAHKDDETRMGNASLPAGIENGIAKLVDWKFGEYKDGKQKGQPFFMAAGIVVSPTHHDGQPIAGMRTQIGPEPLCDTPDRKTAKTLEDHIDVVLNEYRKIGVDTTTMTIEDLEPAAAALLEESPHFRFRTWKGKKQTTGPYKDQEPRTQHEWLGVVEFEGEVEDRVEADDEPVEDEEVEEEEVAEEEETEGDEAEEGGEQMTADELKTMGKEADKGDQDSIVELDTLARELGLNPDSKLLNTWVKVAIAIAKKQDELAEAGDEEEAEETEEEAEEEEVEEAADPEKGATYKWKPPMAKGGKPKKPIDVEITTVDKRKKLVSFKTLDDGKLHKDIPWDKLIDNG